MHRFSAKQATPLRSTKNTSGKSATGDRSSLAAHRSATLLGRGLIQSRVIYPRVVRAR